MLEIWGDKGTLRWCESEPGRLVVLEHGGQEQVYSDDTPPGALGGVDTPFGGSEAHVDALARVYGACGGEVEPRRSRRFSVIRGDYAALAGYLAG